ncbi:MAG: serine hydrolase domain-containing protein [Burkholderiaceae bacterium]
MFKLKQPVTRSLALAIGILALSACADPDSAPTLDVLAKRIDPERPIIRSPKCAELPASGSHPKGAQFQAILERYAAQAWLPGVAAAILSPEGAWSGAAGLADIDQRIAMHPCHAFLSGSVAKFYTVVAALQLVEQGLLGLDEPIAPHLPSELASQLPNAGHATVRQLMNHQAGMPDQDNDPALEAYVLEHEGGLPSAQEQLATLFDDPPRFAPGTATEYSSAHTVALGLVMDEVAGHHHSNQITIGILQRLGLHDTWYKNEVDYPQPRNWARPYLWDEGSLADVSAPAARYALGSQGDAGIYATVADYLRAMKGLFDGRLVSAQTLARMQEPAMVGEVGNQSLAFGLGLFLISRDGEVVKIGHSGLTLGGMMHLYYYPKLQSFVVVAANVMADAPEIQAAFGNGLLVDTPAPTLMTEIEAAISSP